jgi:hypothetical protein
MTNTKPCWETQASVQILSGAVILIAAEGFMFRATEPFASWFYPIAWWSYILIVDGIIYRLQRNSLIINRRREFLVMIPWSVTFWLVFEMVNLRLENWHYVNVTCHLSLRWVGYFISYGTVLPGIFETTELLECLGTYGDVKSRQRVISKFWFPISSVLGGLFLLLPLLVPRYCFPLVWIGFVFLFDPINYAHGAPSLLRDWENGSPRTLLLLLTAGLVCGALWEFWNHWAKSKWIYSVPFFDEMKLFQMPPAGYLGFPPFAVECYVMYNFLSLFRYHRLWDKSHYFQGAGKKLSPQVVILAVIITVSFYALAFSAIDRYTVVPSFSPSSQDIP